MPSVEITTSIVKEFYTKKNYLTKASCSLHF
ncbi:hypothetical protein OpiT1DRAFT_04533 [Opitutaceae bacterium TAV1]|nr:hypothetical protein OpiT1DRAFT_04533 [Opitutaceae bacterium TAV1]